MEAGADGKHSAIRNVAAVVTFAIAVLGALTGTISFVRQQQIELRVTADSYRPSVRPNAIQLAVVNNSARGVSITDGSILFEGKPIGSRLRILADSRLVDDPNVSSREFERAATDLPRAIAAGESLAAVVVWPVSGRGAQADLATMIGDAGFARALRRTPVATLPEGPLKSRIRSGESAMRRLRNGLELRLAIEPGDDRTLRVAIDLEAELGSPSPAVRVRLQTRHGDVTAVVARHSGVTPVMGTLRIWPSRAVRGGWAVTRPIPEASLEGRTVRFPLPDLEPGTYAWALSTAGTVAMTATMYTPCSSVDGKPASGPVDPFLCAPALQEAIRSGNIPVPWPGGP